MDSHDRGLELVRAVATHASRPRDEIERLVDGLPLPQGPILVRQQNERSIAPEAGCGAREVEPHQRQQPERLGLVGHQPHEERSEPLGISGELAAFGRLTCRREVALVEDEVEDAQDLGQAPREL